MPYSTGHPSFVAPPGNPTIWRYIDLARYVSMLGNGCLFFCRADLLDDPFEGSLPLATSMQMDAVAAMSKDREVARRNLAYGAEIIRRYTAVCCWHMDERESWPMWKAYGDSGIAVVSSFQRLQDSFRAVDDHVLIGVIQYRDFDDPQAMHAIGGNSFNLLMSKRDVFASEAEIRAVITRYPEAKVLDGTNTPIQGGVLIPVDLNELTAEVRISPAAEPWRVGLIRDVTERFGYNFPVNQSAMSSSPRW